MADVHSVRFLFPILFPTCGPVVAPTHPHTHTPTHPQINTRTAKQARFGHTPPHHNTTTPTHSGSWLPLCCVMVQTSGKSSTIAASSSPVSTRRSSDAPCLGWVRVGGWVFTPSHIRHTHNHTHSHSHSRTHTLRHTHANPPPTERRRAGDSFARGQVDPSAHSNLRRLNSRWRNRRSRSSRPINQQWRRS